jgi:hypothetical protein
MNLGTTSPTLVAAAFGAYEDVAGGAAIDTDTTLPQKVEYRSSNTSFAKGDGTPSWVEFSKGDYLNQNHTYFQVRVEFRTDHTNS